MKKHFYYLISSIAIISTVLITGCKKGEDDPFISLKSRDARITAKWKLVNYESLESGISLFSGESYSTTIAYNGTLLTTTSTSNGVESIPFTYEMEILKDGELTYTQVSDGSVQSGKANWFWLNNTENKTVIYLDGPLGDIFQIDRLSSSELILSYETEETEIYDGTSYPQKSSLKLTFEKAD